MDALVWMDLETTGLNPLDDYILECGGLVTTADKDMRILDSWSFCVGERPFLENYPMDDFVRNMHRESGLQEAWNNSLKHTLESAWDEVSQILYLVKGEEGIEKYYPAGASIHFDMSFLKEAYGFDKINETFNHRYLDVSALKIFYSLQGIVIPDNDTFKPTHRSTNDILNSRRTLRNLLDGKF